MSDYLLLFARLLAQARYHYLAYSSCTSQPSKSPLPRSCHSSRRPWAFTANKHRRSIGCPTMCQSPAVHASYQLICTPADRPAQDCFSTSQNKEIDGVRQELFWFWEADGRDSLDVLSKPINSCRLWERNTPDPGRVILRGGWLLLGRGLGGFDRHREGFHEL